MSDEASVDRQKRVYRTIKVIEENGGNTNATRAWWPLSNHSGGDQRFPTCGARHSILRKFGDRLGNEILQDEGVPTSRARLAAASSTPVKVERPRLRRPSSWSSVGELTPIKKTPIEVVDLTSSSGGDDSGVGPSPVKMDKVVSLRINAVEPEPTKSRNKIKEEELYSLDHIWDSEEESAKAEERMAGKSSR